MPSAASRITCANTRRITGPLDADALADGILAGVKLPRERLVDDDGQKCAGAILIRENAAANQRDVHGREVARHDPHNGRHQVVDTELAADDIPIASVPAAPQPLSQDHHLVGPADVFLLDIGVAAGIGIEDPMSQAWIPIPIGIATPMPPPRISCE